MKGEIDQDGSVNAFCKFCPNKTVKGHIHATTNFHKHLKVNNSYLYLSHVSFFFSVIVSLIPSINGPLHHSRD